MTRRMSLYKTAWPMVAPIRITGHVFERIEMVVVELSEEGHVGRGEGTGVYYLQDAADNMLEQLESLRAVVEGGLSREEAQLALPPGGARNALDCALWDLEASKAGTSVWDIAGMMPRQVQSVYTIGIDDTPEKMAGKAARAAAFPILKIKLDGEMPVERMTAIRRARPDATLILDANQGFTFAQLQQITGPLAALDVKMIEQPLPRGGDAALAGYRSPIPLCADESCLHREELPAALERYDMINIKLDKTGGLTEALALAGDARAAGKKLMVGNMVGTSLAMTPALVVAQLCDFVDLDGPLALKSDYPGGLVFDNGRVDVPRPGVWGGEASRGEVGTA